MRVTAEQRQRIRANLLRAGLALFARQGFAGTTVDQIAMAAGVAKDTLYNCFPAKEDLALAAFAAALQDMEVAMPEVLACPSLEERLGALFARFDAWAVHPELIWVWALENLRRGGAEAASATLRRLLTALFADAAERGEVRPDRPAAMRAIRAGGQRGRAGPPPAPGGAGLTNGVAAW